VGIILQAVLCRFVEKRCWCWERRNFKSHC